MRNSSTKKRVITILSALTLILSLSYVVYALSIPTINYQTPNNGGYFVQNNSYYVSASVSDSPTSVQLYYNGKAPYLQGNLSLSSGTTYSMTWTPTSSTFFVPTNVGGTWYMPSTNIKATNSAGTNYASKDAYVTLNAMSFYRSIDNTFYYNSETDNSFKGVATGYGPAADGTPNTYNCLAYAIGITDHWVWPWSTNPTFSDLSSYMSSKGYPTAAQGIQSFAKVIYYQNGHFSKVIAWDIYGTPKTIISKWGCSELMQSSASSPFSSVYGPATASFK